MVEVKYFYETKRDKKRAMEITVDDEESLKSELERLGTKRLPDHTAHILTKEQHSKF